MKATEKWPTFFQVKRISDSVLGQAFNVYLIVSVVNAEPIAGGEQGPGAARDN